ncbi:hypothetical protein MXD58_026275, partial [Frankia sp. AgKG'84/4]|nr:hypothetical protein [Frankia sp. AgKG'84/4]
FAHRTVLDNLTIGPMKVLGQKRPQADARRDAATAPPIYSAAPTHAGGMRRRTGVSDRAAAGTGPSQPEPSTVRRPWDSEHTSDGSRWSD